MTTGTGTCKLCSQELVIELFPEDFDEATSSSVGDAQAQSAPDDLMLAVLSGGSVPSSSPATSILSQSLSNKLSATFFHRPKLTTPRQCLLDESPLISSTGTCPSCNTPILTPTPSPQILTTYTNEGGHQPHLDIHPLITEETYL
ncbi:hypothetical protein HYALB_00007379, partial [Hymenoscyphus albidus]